MKKLKSSLPNMLLSLTGFCIVVSAALGMMNEITKEPIAKAEVDAKVTAIKQVVNAFDNNPYEERFEVDVDGAKLTVFPAKKGQEIVGYAVESYTDKGFSGKFTVMYGFDMDGKIHDFSVLSHSETPGLGAKMQEWFRTPAKKEGLIQDVRGVQMSDTPLTVSKDGGQVDAITAATISSRAFLDAMDRAYRGFKAAQGSAGQTEATDDTTQADSTINTNTDNTEAQ